MIKYLKIDNYRTFVNVKINFSNINILLGENGSGKSTIFELVSDLRAFIIGEKDVEKSFPFASLTRWQSVTVQSFEFQLSDGEFDYTYHLEIEFNNDVKKNKVKKENVVCDGNFIFSAEDGKATLYNDLYNAGPEVLVNWLYSGVSAVNERKDNKKLFKFKKAVEKIIVCHPSPKFSSYVFFPSDTFIYPSYDAENICEEYFYALQSNPEKLSVLWGIFKDINPSFCRTYIKGDIGKTLYFEYENNGVKMSYRFSEISDGERMLFILYFLAVIYLNDDYTLLLDEPDNYLSLREVAHFAQYIQDSLKSDGQCILISHHPNIIDYFAAANGIWLSRYSYGASTIVKAPSSDTDLTYSEIILHGGMDEA